MGLVSDLGIFEVQDPDTHIPLYKVKKKKVGENVVFDTFLLSFTHFNIIFINFVFPIVRLNKVTAGTRPFVETGFSIRYILEIIIHNVYLPL